MIRRWAIPITGWLPGRPSKICPKIGCVLCVERVKRCSKPSNRMEAHGNVCRKKEIVIATGC